MRKRSDDPAAQAALDRLIVDLGELSAAADALRKASRDPDHPALGRLDVALLTAIEAATRVLFSAHPVKTLEHAAGAIAEARREFDVAKAAVVADDDA